MDHYHHPGWSWAVRWHISRYAIKFLLAFYKARVSSSHCRRRDRQNETRRDCQSQATAVTSATDTTYVRSSYLVQLTLMHPLSKAPN